MAAHKVCLIEQAFRAFGAYTLHRCEAALGEIYDIRPQTYDCTSGFGRGRPGTRFESSTGHGPHPLLSPSEVKGMKDGVNSPEVYLKLAGYFKQVAAQEQDAALLHEQIAAMYVGGKMAPMVGMNSLDTEVHCNEFAKSAHRAAAKDLKMAAQYEKEADDLKNRPSQHGGHR